MTDVNKSIFLEHDQSFIVHPPVAAPTVDGPDVCLNAHAPTQLVLNSAAANDTNDAPPDPPPAQCAIQI